MKPAYDPSRDREPAGEEDSLHEVFQVSRRIAVQYLPAFAAYRDGLTDHAELEAAVTALRRLAEASHDVPLYALMENFREHDADPITRAARVERLEALLGKQGAPPADPLEQVEGLTTEQRQELRRVGIGAVHVLDAVPVEELAQVTGWSLEEAAHVRAQATHRRVGGRRTMTVRLEDLANEDTLSDFAGPPLLEESPTPAPARDAADPDEAEEEARTEPLAEPRSHGPPVADSCSPPQVTLNPRAAEPGPQSPAPLRLTASAWAGLSVAVAALAVAAWALLG